MIRTAMRPGPTSTSGFTLVEALVAIAIISLLLTTIFGSLRVTGRSWEAAARRTDANDALRLGLDFLRRQIEQAIPLLMSDGEDEQLLFRGEGERLEFVSPLPMHAGGAAMHWLVLEATEADNGERNLVVSYRPVHTLREFPGAVGADHAGMDQVSVIEGIGGVTFHYFGSDHDGEAPRWHDSWNHRLRMPELVQFTLHAGRPVQQLPELLIPLRTDNQSARPPFLLNVSSPGIEPLEP